MNFKTIFALFLLVLMPQTLLAHKVPTNIKEITLSKVADDVYVVHGVRGMPNKENKGFISNSGIVIADEGIVIIDTGGSLKYGEMLIEKIRKISDKPVIAVINTHLHGDHWLGNAAIRKAYPDVKIYAHEQSIARLKSSEASTWMEMFGTAMGKDIAGSEAVIPDKALKHGDSLTLAGNTYKAHHTGTAHTDGDIMIEHPAQKLLFAGDVVVYGSVPSSARPQDFSAKGQIAAIEHALGLDIKTIVPGHGPTGNREIAEACLKFLKILHGSVKREYDEGLADFEMR
ncbi:MAG: MBL fold metallo-hydrolase, partial [Chloroflexota bacterium]